MIADPVISKVAAPYAKALVDQTLKYELTHQITLDMDFLNATLNGKDKTLLLFVKNPLILPKDKLEVLSKLLTSNAHPKTLTFLNLLIKRNRFQLLDTIANQYLQSVYKTATIREIQVQTAFPFTKRQINKLTNKLKAILNVREIKLVFTEDSSLIGGFSLKTHTKRVDFTIKDKLNKLSKLLDYV